MPEDSNVYSHRHESEVIAIHSENHKKHITVLCGRNEGFVSIKENTVLKNVSFRRYGLRLMKHNEKSHISVHNVDTELIRNKIKNFTPFSD
jgi:hypothetical protein